MGVLVKWLLALVLLVAGAVGVNAWWASRPDLTCPGPASTGLRDATYGLRTQEDALGRLLDDADRVTKEPHDDQGFHSVTYRGYDADGELLTMVVLEGGGRGWVAARVDTCE